MISVLTLAAVCAAAAPPTVPVEVSTPPARAQAEAFEEKNLSRLFDGALAAREEEHEHEDGGFSFAVQLKAFERGVHDDGLHFHALPALGHAQGRGLRAELSRDVWGARYTHRPEDEERGFELGAHAFRPFLSGSEHERRGWQASSDLEFGVARNVEFFVESVYRRYDRPSPFAEDEGAGVAVGFNVTLGRRR